MSNHIAFVSSKPILDSAKYYLHLSTPVTIGSVYMIFLPVMMKVIALMAVMNRDVVSRLL